MSTTNQRRIMSFISSNTKIALISTATVVVTAFTSYALYFDYKRRNDPVFRKSLSKSQFSVRRSVQRVLTTISHCAVKQAKKVQRNTAQQQASGTQDKVLALQRALLLINAEPSKSTFRSTCSNIATPRDQSRVKILHGILILNSFSSDFVR